MMRLSMFFLTTMLIVTCSASGAQKFSVLESDKVSFDGKKMVFTDGVHLETGQGKISANKAEIAMDGPSKFTEARLAGAVKIHYGDRFTASSDSANISSEGMIILQRDASADYTGFGTLTTDKELTLKINLGKRGELEYVKCSGETILRRDDNENHPNRYIRCNGEVFLDNEKRQLHLVSEAGQQLYFQENQAKIYADTALLEYEVGKDGKFSPTHIALEGNVRLANREGMLLQYVLADRVDMLPQSQEMHFKAFEKKRVLFYDKVNNLQTSAPELRMKRDKVTQKDSFQGVGDVRFNFNEQEFEQLRKRFLPDEK